MRKAFLILAAALVAVACSDNLGPDRPSGKRDRSAELDAVFSGMPEIRLSVSEDEWNRLLGEYDSNAGTQEYFHCDVSFTRDGKEYAVRDAGLRLKGNTSRRRPEGKGGERHNPSAPDWHHAHFGLNLRKYRDTLANTVMGVGRMDLKWFKDDPAYVREIYCYDLFRRFGVWTAVRDTYCRLWLRVGSEDAAYFGVYGLMEHVGGSYLKARSEAFGGAGGNLWKCSYPADLKSTSADFGPDDNVHTHVYELKTNTAEGFSAASAQIRDFIGKVNSLSGEAFQEWIASVMDIDLFLRTVAVNVAVGMWDDFWNNYNNFYLYFNTTDPASYKVWLIPYDYDNTLGTSNSCGVLDDSGRKNPLSWGHQSSPLISKVLKKTEWKELYVKYLKELCDPSRDLFDAESSAARIKAWQDSVSPYVSNDTGEDMTIEDRPASWGNHSEYRILTPGSSNFFSVKASVISGL